MDKQTKHTKMGNRYYVSGNCPYCGHSYNDEWVSPTTGSVIKKCERCMFWFYLGILSHSAKKLENFTLENFTEVFLLSTSIHRSEKETKHTCENLYNNIVRNVSQPITT